MTFQDDELLQDYVTECREHLADIESHLLAMEAAGADVDENLVNQVFRAAHSIKGGAGLFNLTTIKTLAHKTENVLGLMRTREMVPTPEAVNILLLAFDRLRDLIGDIAQSNDADVSEVIDALTDLVSATKPVSMKPPVNPSAAPPERSSASGSPAPATAPSAKAPEEQLQPADAAPTPLAGTEGSDGSSQEGLGEVAQAGGEAKEALAGPAPEFESVQWAPEKQVAGDDEVLSKQRSDATPGHPSDTTLRVNVALLEQLMDLAGELVLSRNQLSEAIAGGELDAIRVGGQRISTVTSDLQQTIMQTRLQPIGIILSRFPRLVRDLSRRLGKESKLELVGEDVEMDKTIVEGLGDPLTHMVRNAVDHGIEAPDARWKAGKPSVGTIRICAYHEAGQVVVEVSDDGCGLDPKAIGAAAVRRGAMTAEQVRSMSDKELRDLVFLPGVSTAKQVTDVSGRGVGMDVVKSNLERLGGKVEIESTLGKGTLFRIKLPLTLAIIPSLLVSVAGERFALPQVNVSELLCFSEAEAKQRFERIGEAEVLTVRGELLPVIRLDRTLGITRTFVDEDRGVAMTDRRERLADRRGPRHEGEAVVRDRRVGEERRAPTSGEVSVAILSASSLKYGLVVDELHDTIEIVVKPLGRHLRGMREYAGATIMGDGKVALILDVNGLAAKARLSAVSQTLRGREVQDESSGIEHDEANALLLFCNGPAEWCAVPLVQVARVEQIRASAVECIGNRHVMQYRGGTLPLLRLCDTTNLQPLADCDERIVIVSEVRGRPVGLLASHPVDVVDLPAAVDRDSLRQKGVQGSAIIHGSTTLLIDLEELVEATHPEWMKVAAAPAEGTKGPTVLLAEDSEFFCTQLRKYLEGDGYRVIVAQDGERAWELLGHNAGRVDLVLTDIEMPHLDGLGLARRIRSDDRLCRLPIIALSSLASEEDIARGIAAGATEYLVKLDKERLLEAVRDLLQRPLNARA